jgi:hypothetical protein
MKSILILVLAITLFATGCTALDGKGFGSRVLKPVKNVVISDLKTAIKLGEEKLGSTDPMVMCYKAVQRVLEVEVLKSNGLLLTEMMRLRIAAQVRESLGAELPESCGVVALEIISKMVM